MIYLSLVNFTYNTFDIFHEGLLDLLYKGIPIAILIFAFLMILNGIVVIKKEGKRLANFLPIAMGLGIFVYAIIFILYYNYVLSNLSKLSYLQLSLLTNGFYLISFLFMILLFTFFSLMAYSILYLNLPKKKNYNYIIIHGSGLIDGYKVSPLLASRIEKGIEAYNKSQRKDVKFIASGGQGSDEKISEAKSISNYLIEKGIEQEKIILEDKSTTTYENLMFSKEIAEKYDEKPIYVFISNNYHNFRTTIYARRLNMNGYGVGAKTAGYYIPSAFVREYIAIVFRLKKVILSLVGILILLMILTNL